MSNEVLFEDHVHSEWVDYNGHLNDAEYARVFSIAVDRLMDKLGIDASFRDQHQYSIYTLETHLCYLAEIGEGEHFQVLVQILDADSKRIHAFFVMEDDEGTRLATSEQMLMGMDMNEGRPSPFPLPVDDAVKNLAEQDQDRATPDEAGRTIGIRRRKV